MTIVVTCLPVCTGELGRHCWMPAHNPISPSKVISMNETDMIPVITELTVLEEGQTSKQVYTIDCS